MAATMDEEFDFTKKAEYSAKVFNASMVQVMYYIEWMVFVLGCDDLKKSFYGV